MPSPYIGITGVMNSADARACLDMVPDDSCKLNLALVEKYLSKAFEMFGTVQG